MNLAESKKEANNLTTVHFVAPFIDTFFLARICELEPIWCWKFLIDLRPVDPLEAVYQLERS